MDVIIKCAAAALLSCLICLLIKRTNPEMSMVLGAGAIVMIIPAAIGFASSLLELAAAVRNMCGSADVLISPVLKCVGIGAVTKISAELCKDSSQSSAAAAVDMAGTLCAIGVSMPLIMSMLKMIGDMT